MNLNINDEYFGELLPFVKDEKITDITWNGSDLWLDDLERGRYKSPVKLSDQFINTFSTRLANLANKNFNMSEPLLEAETDELRISVIDDTVTNTNKSIAIRKTPAKRRLNEKKMIEDGYSEAMVLKLLEMFVRGHCSIIVTGDVGSGKTELVKYLTKFIPDYERTISIEDNYELRLSKINPNLDCVEIKASADGPFTYQYAIKAALRQLCKWLLMAEARSKEVIQLLEAASTGCVVMTTMHADDVRKIPDRVVNMMGIDGEEKRNDVYNFFDVGIKINIQKTETGIFRSIDQICVMDRDAARDENNLYLIYNNGFTGTPVPNNVWRKVAGPTNSPEDIEMFSFLAPDNICLEDVKDTPEFAKKLADSESKLKQEILNHDGEFIPRVNVNITRSKPLVANNNEADHKIAVELEQKRKDAEEKRIHEAEKRIKAEEEKRRLEEEKRLKAEEAARLAENNKKLQGRINDIMSILNDVQHEIDPNSPELKMPEMQELKVDDLNKLVSEPKKEDLTSAVTNDKSADKVKEPLDVPTVANKEPKKDSVTTNEKYDKPKHAAKEVLNPFADFMSEGENKEDSKKDSNPFADFISENKKEEASKKEVEKHAKPEASEAKLNVFDEFMVIDSKESKTPIKEVNKDLATPKIEKKDELKKSDNPFEGLTLGNDSSNPFAEFTAPKTKPGVVTQQNTPAKPVAEPNQKRTLDDIVAADELKRQIALMEQSKKTGKEIPDDEMAKIKANLK